jgi:hypothetical protein
MSDGSKMELKSMYKKEKHDNIENYAIKIRTNFHFQFQWSRITCGSRKAQTRRQEEERTKRNAENTKEDVCEKQKPSECPD